MKVLGISAGTSGGSNDAMCKEALMGAKELGAEIEFINLHKLNIRHCTGCKACVMSLFSGKGNACVLKDDFQWLVDKMYEADGIVWAVPIFEKGAPGIFHTVMDRFGPRLDRGNVMIAQKIAEQGGKPIDPKYLKEIAVSYMGIGGSDWATRIQCDFATQALTPRRSRTAPSSPLTASSARTTAAPRAYVPTATATTSISRKTAPPFAAPAAPRA